MLLRNESKIKHIIQVKLVFDDDKTKELEIQEGDKIHVSYRKNGFARCGIGIIKEIKPYVYSKRLHFSRKESATIIVDMSIDNMAKVEMIDLYDIIDIIKLPLADAETEDGNGEEVVIHD